MIRRLDINSDSYKDDLAALAASSPVAQIEIQNRVSAILEDVRTHGDTALLKYAQDFDGVKAETAAGLEVDKSLLEKALNEIDPELKAALETAAQRIRDYHQHQQEGVSRGDYEFEDQYLNRFWQKTIPMDKVGLYVPGGKAFYPSSVLMNAIPAKVAGVKEVSMAVPIGYSGSLSPVVLAAAAIAGVDRVFTMGGAQAIAAFAYGTDTVPAVDKIVGPGNTYVALAKRAVYGHVGIDMIAGPSEILVIADKALPIDSAVYDLFSQAEHDEMAQSILISTDQDYLDQVEARIYELLPEQPRQDVIKASLQNRGAFVKVNSWKEAIQLSNALAPEHLELAFADVDQYVDQVTHAGSVFVGVHTTESFGDYCSGTNHVLPTSGSARFSSPLGVHDFQKRTSFTRCSQQGANFLGPVAATMARAEHLEAHALAAESRVEKG
ncbi:MAG: histidinol dehydrogenase [Gammaproteobacteria bacterium]|nr:histidinol dehydrogenase [Gammaproteobacteria bacterium]HBF07231.1 histidinol dehydrogenase [Gammaproteobacteria bacterium]|tara:strand:+ start:239 stop:1552 length:1314 start_codon:yes stop_codon:yes gene_type:complete